MISHKSPGFVTTFGCLLHFEQEDNLPEKKSYAAFAEVKASLNFLKIKLGIPLSAKHQKRF